MTDMNRRDFLTQSGLVLGGLALSVDALAQDQGSAERPDVLFMVAEDLQTTLGCYGEPMVQTPNLDGVAARGVRFDNAQCQYPVCNPSRASFLSGLRPATTGVWGNATDWSEHLKPGTTLPEFFHAKGYDTVKVGKIFHSGNAGRKFDEAPRWDRIINYNEGMPPRKHKPRPPRALYAHVPPEERKKTYRKRAWMWGPTGLDDLEMPDGRMAEHAARVLRAKREKPLFLAVGFYKPHLSLTAPDKYFDMYPPDKIPVPETRENDFNDLPRKYNLESHETFTPETRREAIAAYYACCSYIDACAGRVLKALRESGRERNTIVVFLGDHGYHIGEHFLWQKNTLFEESCRVPLILAAPGVAAPGTVCKRPVELVDLYPTLADLCGLPIPQGLEGLSLVPLLRNPDGPWKKCAFTYIRGGKSLRTERWRYSEWGGPKSAELYDHDADPCEFTNLAKDPAHAETVKELSGLMKGDWKAALPE